MDDARGYIPRFYFGGWDFFMEMGVYLIFAFFSSGVLHSSLGLYGGEIHITIN